jgi:hypothetical protein
MRELSTLMLYLTAIILVLRGPYALQAKASRPGWLAGAFGLVAVICLGFWVPVPAIDAALGSRGYWNLLGATSTTLSFHFMYQAILIYTSSEAPRRYYPCLGLSIAAYSSAFLLISGEQGHFTSVEGFIAALISQPSTALYLTIYLADVAVISLLSLLAVLRSQQRSKVFIAGFSLVILGNAIDICLLWLQHGDILGDQAQVLLYSSYVATFFSGAIILCIGFLRGSMQSLHKYCAFIYYALILRRILKEAGIEQPTIADTLRDPKITCYQALILIRDLMTLGKFALTTADLALTHRTDVLLTEFPLTSPT